MKLNKHTAYILLHILSGTTSSSELNDLMTVSTRTIQRILAQLTNINILFRKGPSNNHNYSINFDILLNYEIPSNVIVDVDRPKTNFNFNLVKYLENIDSSEIDTNIDSLHDALLSRAEMSLRDIEHLTVELSWKSSELEGNSYTLLDTELLIKQGIKAKNKTSFETQMILNHKNAIQFIIANKELFKSNIELKTVEHVHSLIADNLGIEKGVRERIVKIGASNYTPLTDPHLIKESLLRVLDIINSQKSTYTKTVLAFSLFPYLQAFEDGNKRTGRMIANAILIANTGKGFSLKEISFEELALGYLSFYEYNSINKLNNILKKSIELN